MPRIFRSTDAGSPGDTPSSIGALCPIWDAILVTGYPLQTVTATSAGGIATVTLAAHGFATGNVKSISGAVQDEYNGNKTITVTDANTFTYPITGTPVSPATGTVRCSTTTTGLGWRLAFTGTNKRAYKMRIGTGFYLRLDHTVNQYNARTRGYETMTDVDTGTGPFPTVAQMATGVIAKISNAASARSWVAMGDDRTFMFFSHTNGPPGFCGFHFGDFPSYKPGDAFNCFIQGSDNESANSQGDRMNEAKSDASTTAQGATFLARSYTQTGSAITASKGGDWVRCANNQSGAASLPYPCTVDGGLHVARFIIYEPNQGPRGLMRGLWQICHNRAVMTGTAHLDTFQGSDILSSKTFQIFDMFDMGSSNTIVGRLAAEISDTWETF